MTSERDRKRREVDARVTPAAEDIENLAAVRKNVDAFLERVSLEYASEPGRLLDVAPQDHRGSRPFFDLGIEVETLDIAPDARATFTADLCKCNDDLIEDARYDYIVCTEVLEHTLQPFTAVDELYRIARPGGYLFLTVPFNLRIHGPLPDCWRFTEHGLRALLRSFSIWELRALETQDRPLMPIHYTVVAQK